MKQLIKCLSFAIAVVLCVLIYSCERRPLYDLEPLRYVRVYLDEEIKNVTTEPDSIAKPDSIIIPDKEYFRPTVFKMIIADMPDGDVINRTILRDPGTDSSGNYLDGYISVPEGDYNILIYDIGSYDNNVVNEENFNEIKIYTNHISDRQIGYIPTLKKRMDMKKIVMEPNHFFRYVGRNLHIPSSRNVDTLKDNSGRKFIAQTIITTYKLKFKITGAEWVKSGAVVLGGMTGSAFLGRDDLNVERDSVGLFFDLKYNEKEDVVYTTFNSFEKLEDIKTKLEMFIEFIKTDGSSQVEVIDLTNIIKSEEFKKNQQIVIDEKIVIIPAQNPGGMTPSVGGWRDIETDLPM